MVEITGLATSLGCPIFGLALILWFSSMLLSASLDGIARAIRESKK